MVGGRLVVHLYQPIEISSAFYYFPLKVKSYIKLFLFVTTSCQGNNDRIDTQLLQGSLLLSCPNLPKPLFPNLSSTLCCAIAMY